MQRTMKAGVWVLVFLVLGFAVLMPAVSEADCPDRLVECYCNREDFFRKKVIGAFYTGACFNWLAFRCSPTYCSGYKEGDLEKRCNETFTYCKDCPGQKCSFTGVDEDRDFWQP